ncbi:hypothetical protein PBI_MRMAGOO_63 [Mycobacterium phage MrMagoo]|uniref:Uncharacterized protein n=1 Tax=Mycobacterium phage MrMagoo TaxID=1927020 RepID=A0A1L6BYJ0_9CAUD|nr:hypothetical protein J4U04_gp063 [Mycobacterium phage MrMagoo]APQ42167.1 hypothetical protein PBI_MRMAGOO_63 [Mycobacterium phage MrMagoo]ARM70243.1 hypothetical protein SEA_GARDENSALSA_63 [Mycobacterium phage GardenSalsa]
MTVANDEIKSARCSMGRAIDQRDEGLRMEVLRQSVRALDPTVEPEDFIEFMDDIATWVKTGEVS